MSAAVVKVLLGLLIVTSAKSQEKRTSANLDNCLEDDPIIKEHVFKMGFDSIDVLTKKGYIIDVDGRVSDSKDMAKDSTGILLVTSEIGLVQIQKTKDVEDAKKVVNARGESKPYCAKNNKETYFFEYIGSDCFLYITKCAKVNGNVYLMGWSFNSYMLDNEILTKRFYNMEDDTKLTILTNFIDNFDFLHKRGINHGLIHPKYLILLDNEGYKTSVRLPVVEKINNKFSLNEQDISKFLAPEQVKNINTVSDAGDIYSLGLSFLWMLGKGANFILDDKCIIENFDDNCKKQLGAIQGYEFIGTNMHRLRLHLSRATSTDISLRLQGMENFKKSLNGEFKKFI